MNAHSARCGCPDCIHPRGLKSPTKRWNETVAREVVKAVKRRDFEFAYFLTQQLLED